MHASWVPGSSFGRPRNDDYRPAIDLTETTSVLVVVLGRIGDFRRDDGGGDGADLAQLGAGKGQQDGLDEGIGLDLGAFGDACGEEML